MSVFRADPLAEAPRLDHGDLPERRWPIFLRGAASLLFGIAAFAWPHATLSILVILYGVYAIADGLLAILAGFAAGTMREKSWAVLAGTAGVAIGSVALFWPKITVVVLVVLIGIWAVAGGILQVVASLERSDRNRAWPLALVGIASILFGTIILLVPHATIVMLALLLGCYAAGCGLFLMLFSIMPRYPARSF